MTSWSDGRGNLLSGAAYCAAPTSGSGGSQALTRVAGAVFLVVAVWMLVTQIS
ncbi:hypothetical protein [Streptomyces chryseus]